MSPHSCAQQKMAALVSSPVLAVGGQRPPLPRAWKSFSSLGLRVTHKLKGPRNSQVTLERLVQALSPTALPGPRERHGGQDCAFRLLSSLLQALGSPRSLPGLPSRPCAQVKMGRGELGCRRQVSPSATGTAAAGLSCLILPGEGPLTAAQRG